jgi:hypothetical protein
LLVGFDEPRELAVAGGSASISPETCGASSDVVVAIGVQYVWLESSRSEVSFVQLRELPQTTAVRVGRDD